MQVIQLIPSAIWKSIYQDYLKAYIKASFVDALGDFEGIKDKQFQI
jgi:hypothetical protein